MDMIVNDLPGGPAPYAIRSGRGPRHLIGGMVAALYATGAETGGGFCLAMLTGGREAGLPLLRHAQSHVALQVLEGEIELVLDGRRWRLLGGDYASIPAGRDYALRMTRLRNRALLFQTGAEAGRMLVEKGRPYDGHVQPDRQPGSWRDLAPGPVAGCDTVILGAPDPALPEAAPLRDMPKAARPYVLEAGCGRHLLVGDQLFTFSGANDQSGGRFLTLLTEGPEGPMIPPHKHLLHDESFFCGAGRIRMKAGEAEIELAPGDFLFVPRGTPHAFQFLDPYTRIIGFLTPGLFEPFFGILGEETDITVYPQSPGPFRFDRVLERLDELDIVPLGRPGGPQA
ncbi:cupin domain-containing protein [Mangrovicoccus algicola]|uniref:Cupin domain-containing protein n=1 Tax=Mangrovicoccus algicola TaxID=2771008 RepID=A0A8J7CJ21_9RHOB|nr:cupin domain-containing protein [Mangrovicoccus algicola]MBE3640290.1 cupin domain-containing protein [Mangrovicoccus algicola]